MWRESINGWLYVEQQKNDNWSQASKVFDAPLVRRIDALSDEDLEELWTRIGEFGHEFFEDLRMKLNQAAATDDEVRSGRSEAAFVKKAWVPYVVAKDDQTVADLAKLISDQLKAVDERWRYDAYSFISMLLFLKFDPDESRFTAAFRTVLNHTRKVTSRVIPSADILRVEVSPEYRQVAIGDPHAVDLPEIEDTELPYFASSQQVYVFTRGASEGHVKIIVSRKGPREGEMVKTYGGHMTLTLGRLEVGTIVGADMTSARVGKPGVYEIHVFTSPASNADTVRVVVGPMISELP